MGRMILELPDEIHDRLRHRKVDTKIDIKDQIITAIEKDLEWVIILIKKIMKIIPM